MAYERTTWECGDVVTAEKMNKIERGLADMDENYVPTEWECGDVITAEKMNKIESELAYLSENCGGGECDFSTAEVSIINSTGMSVDIDSHDSPVIYDDGEHAAVMPSFSEFGVADGTTLTYNVPLYKGYLFWYISSGFVPTGCRISGTTGDIEYDAEFSTFTITGDGTITLAYSD